MQEDSLTYCQLNDTLLSDTRFLDCYFLKDYSSSTPLFPNDSSELRLVKSESKHENLSQQPIISDWIFCIFLILFVFFGSIGKKIGIFRSVTGELFAVKERKSIFYESTENEWYGKLLLSVQTCILLSIFLYKYFTSNLNLILNTPAEVLLFIGESTLMLVAFIFIKWISYNITGIVFFDKSTMQIWINNFFSLFAFSGIVLFIPILSYFYADTAISNFCFYIIVIYFFLFEFFIMYKSFVLFFHKPSYLLNLFLYLCAQEIIPLFFLWEIVVRMFNFAEK